MASFSIGILDFAAEAILRQELRSIAACRDESISRRARLSVVRLFAVAVRRFCAS